MADEMPPDPFEQTVTEEIPDDVREARAALFDAWSTFIQAAGECIAIDKNAQLHWPHWAWTSGMLTLHVHQHSGPNTVEVIADIPMDNIMEDFKS